MIRKIRKAIISYILNSEVFDISSSLPTDKGGEIQMRLRNLGYIKIFMLMNSKAEGMMLGTN
ncbi:hypothetical protein DEAC_c21540 [Desulfosporosinus acididurans]|uniref:Uncharacterized protein n=1 Tax=Desulfosporosinus acididurans TaxID=476652 RepID=A0A0J1FRL0_9FIRM|nr:hypothetical protein DEAC_c21540 [Desulfosporosinus acididurans]